MSDTGDRAIALALLIEWAEPYVIPQIGTPGVKQVETFTILGSIGSSGAGNAAVIVTAAGMAGSPKTIQVAVANNDTPYLVATKIRAALAADTDVSALFDISGVGVDGVLTAKTFAAHDSSLNVSIANGTCSGLTAAPTSVNTVEGSAPDTSTLETILDRNKPASTWLPNTAYAFNAIMMPPVRNGFRYRCIVTGTSQATDPGFYFWPKTQLARVTDGISNPALVWQNDGSEWGSVYDARQAAYECWDMKYRKASQYFAQGQVHMEMVTKHCQEMRDSFAPLVVG